MCIKKVERDRGWEEGLRDRGLEEGLREKSIKVYGRYYALELTTMKCCR